MTVVVVDDANAVCCGALMYCFERLRSILGLSGMGAKRARELLGRGWALCIMRAMLLGSRMQAGWGLLRGQEWQCGASGAGRCWGWASSVKFWGWGLRPSGPVCVSCR